MTHPKNDRHSFFDYHEDEILRIKRGSEWIRLSEAMREKGCFICSLVKMYARKGLNFLLYEYVLDAGVRKQLHRSFGFCNLHAWLAREVEAELQSDGQHIGTLYESLVQAEIRLLRHASEIHAAPSGPKGFFRRRKSSSPLLVRATGKSASEECLICETCRNTEEFYIHESLRLYSDKEFRSLYENAPVLLCRPHFHFLIREAGDTDAVNYFIHEQIGKLQELSKRLTLFLDLHEHTHAGEPRGEEQTSWLEALEYFSSKPGITRPNESTHQTKG